MPFLRFFNCFVLNIKIFHAFRTWKNNKHPIFIEAKMKHNELLDYLDIANDQIKHLESLRWHVDINRVAFTG